MPNGPDVLSREARWEQLDTPACGPVPPAPAWNPDTHVPAVETDSANERTGRARLAEWLRRGNEALLSCDICGAREVLLPSGRKAIAHDLDAHHAAGERAQRQLDGPPRVHRVGRDDDEPTPIRSTGPSALSRVRRAFGEDDA